MATVAVVQLNSQANVKSNLLEIAKYFIEAKNQGVSLLVLPENFAFMGATEFDKLHIAETLGNGEIQQEISRLAKKYKMWVVAGTIPIKSTENRVTASSLVYDDQGACVTCYNKIHLFDAKVAGNELYQESLAIERGNQIVVIDTPIGRLGLSVCYDLRFPKLYRQMVLKGAEIFTVASAFTQHTGAAHWEVLLRARSIENLCYVLASNQNGVHANGRSTYGHSMIIDPWGEIINQQKTGSGLVIANLDLSKLYNLRHNLPCNDHHVL